MSILKELKVTVRKKLPEGTHIYQVEDGTEYYWKMHGLQRLYVIWNGEEVDAKLPHQIGCMGTCGNAIYLIHTLRCGEIGAPSLYEIHRAVFSTTYGIIVSLCRKADTYASSLQGKYRFGTEFCCRYRGEEEYIFGISDDQENNGIVVNLSDDEKKGIELIGFYRKTAIYTKSTWNQFPSVRKIKDNAILVEGSSMRYSHFRDSNSFVYFFGQGQSLYTLNTETLTFLPPLTFWTALTASEHIRSIVGVFKGMITVECAVKENSDTYQITLKLPTGYYEKPASIAKKLMGRIKESLTITPRNSTDIQSLATKSRNSSDTQSLTIMPRTSSNVSTPPRIKELNGDPRSYSSKFSSEFEIKKVLGRGGYGIVFEAVYSIDNWTYAVKRISVDTNQKNHALGEAQAMAQLDHPGIVRYHHAWIEIPPEGWQKNTDDTIIQKFVSERNDLKMSYRDVFIYIQMQICKFSLSEWLAWNSTEASRPINRMKSWFKQITSAVSYIHEKNLIHRDLKPGNILFFEHDHLKLCDLGIVTERTVDEGTESSLYRTNIGTLLYMSPEQILCKKSSSKADVFSLGLILAVLCVVMTKADRILIFNNYRSGKQCDRIADENTRKFVEMLTQVEPKNRPTCQQMLDHLYLA